MLHVWEKTHQAVDVLSYQLLKYFMVFTIGAIFNEKLFYRVRRRKHKSSHAVQAEL